MQRTSAIVLIVLLVTAVGTAGTAYAADEYAIELSPAVETPPRPVSIGSETFTVSALGRVDPGETVTADVSAPASPYDVVVYDDATQVVASKNASGDGTVEFDTDGWDPGLYLVAVEVDGDRETVMPLLVSAYHVDVAAPDEAAPDASIEVEVDLTITDEPVEVGTVTAIVANDAEERMATLEAAGEGSYVGSVDLGGLPEGGFSIFVAVEDDEGLVAFSDPTELTIESTEEDVELDDVEADAERDVNTSEETTTEVEAQADAEPTATESPDEEATETATPAPTSTVTTTDRVAANTDEEVVTQAPPTESDDETAEPAGLAGIPLVLAVVAAAFLLLLVAYRLR